MFSVTTATKKVSKLSKRIRAVQGGTSASKTISILLTLIAEAQTDETPKLTSVVSESMPHLKRGALRDFKNLMKAQGYWKQNRWNSTDKIYTFETGSMIEFFPADDADKLRGGRRDRLFLNEANNVHFESFEQLEFRTREYIFLDWNPTNEFWFYTEVLGVRDDVEHLILTYKDNEALEASIVQSIEARKEREGWWKVYGLGQLGEVEGKIYKGWKIVENVPHEARLERYGLDFGYSNDPTAIVAVYYLNGGYILDEVAYQTGLLNKAIADILKAQDQQRLTVADSAEPKSIDEIKGYGVSIIGADKGQDSVRHGINLVQDLSISVTKRSANIIHEYRNYLWKYDKNGQLYKDAKGNTVPEHEYSHAMDAIRYALSELKKHNNDGDIEKFYSEMRRKKAKTKSKGAAV